MTLIILEMLLGGGGFILFGMTVSWWGAFAIFLMIFGNNIGHSIKML